VAASGVPPVYFDITRKDSATRTRVFGPWVSMDAPDSRAHVLFPLFGHYDEARESGTWVFPTFFHRRTDDGYALDTLFPLFWHSSGPAGTTTLVGPVFWH